MATSTEIPTPTPAEEFMLGFLRPEADLDVGPVPAELTEWLRSVALPLETVEPRKGVDDLLPLREVIGEARVVGMGEATHGTSEFFSMKHRLFEFLVEEMGFTTFGIESGFAESLKVNDYVRGADNREEALAAVGGGRSAELIHLIEWMRERNAAGQTPQLGYYGFDMQSTTTPVLRAIAAAREIDPETVSRLETVIAPVAASFGTAYYRGLPESDRRLVRAALAEVVGVFDAALAAGGGDAVDLDRGRLLARSAQHAEAYVGAPSQRVRDESMTATVLDILDMEGPDSKMALWAHNGHVERGILIEMIDAQRIPAMGQLLRDKLGRSYAAVSFAFDSGSFRASEVGGAGKPRDFSVGPALPYSLDAAFAGAGLPLAAFPMTDAPTTGPAADWLGARPGARCIGGASSETLAQLTYVRNDPRVSADVFVFVAETTAARKQLGTEDESGADEGRLSPKPVEPEALRANLDFGEPDDTGRPRGWTPRPNADGIGLSVEGEPGESAVLVVRRGGPAEGEATATHEVPVPAGARVVEVSGELSAAPGEWPSGAYLLLRYDSKGSISEQLTRPPFILAPSFPVVQEEWQPVRAKLALADGLDKISVAVCLAGTGETKLRSLRVDFSR